MWHQPALPWRPTQADGHVGHGLWVLACHPSCAHTLIRGCTWCSVIAHGRMPELQPPTGSCVWGLAAWRAQTGRTWVMPPKGPHGALPSASLGMFASFLSQMNVLA